MAGEKVIYEWVKGRFVDEQLKYAKSLSGAGVGYVILSQGYDQSSRQSYAVMAFKRPLGKLPPHLELCSTYESDKLDKIDDKRSGLK